ncbi:MAG: SpoIID/LytB domain-containing protein [Lachnospiraceae bacterium]|nr:SpoIID/LytB domain-containing protein [Lachnospiraceae bacterium]
MKKPWNKVLIVLVVALLVILADAWNTGKIKIYYQDSEEKAQGGETKHTKEENVSVPPGISSGKEVRVLLSTSNYVGVYHDKVTVCGTKGMTVRIDGKEETYAPKEKVAFLSTKEKKQVTISPVSGGRLQLLSVTRQNRHPAYRGMLELNWTKQGYTLINEIPLEQYLYAVVPSELSTGSKMEALKAQAVCARTYAYNQIAAGRFRKYNADLDDSVSCQVYNNLPEDKRSRMAVNATKNQVVTKNSKRVQAYYYSTSWGKSASGKEVWETEKEISYLQSSMQQEGSETNGDMDLSKETSFRKFMTQTDIATYDKGSEWYRWSVVIPEKSLANRIDATLQECYRSNRSKVLTQQKNGTYRKQPLKSIGKLKNIRVEKRGKSGIVTQLVVVGSNTVVKVSSQYNVRKILAPGSIPVSLKKRKTSVSMLPSAAFYIDRVKSKEGISYEIYGGGFGHGTGMSQYGAVEMAKQGKNYEEILQFYFAGCEVAEAQK